MEAKKDKIAIIFVFVLFIAVGVVALIKHISDKKIVRPDTDFVAIISHSQLYGSDAGVEYIYYIYEDKNSYVYFKTKYEITISGNTEEQELSSGRLKEKSDFNDIIKDIEKDKKEGTIRHVYYTYKYNGNTMTYENANELANKLW